MLTKEELKIKLFEFMGKEIPLSDKQTNNILGKINKQIDSEERILLHNLSVAGIKPTSLDKQCSPKEYTIPDNFIPQFKKEPSVLFMTHGTRFSPTPPNDNYFFSEKVIPDSNEYTREIAEYFQCRDSHFLQWQGTNTHAGRLRGANKIFMEITSILFDIGKGDNIEPDQIPVILAGHSQGGNDMMIVANKLLQLGFNVVFLFTLSTPRRPEYKLQFDINHLNLFSYKDWIQLAGGWDFDIDYDGNELNCTLDYMGTGGRQFTGAVNICYDSKVGDEDNLAFYEIRKHFVWTSCLHHQITRWSNFVLKCIKKSIPVGNGQ